MSLAQTPVGPPRRRRPTHAVWQVLLGQADVIADSITLSLFEGDPRWHDLVDAQVRADVRVSSRRHIRRGLQTLSGLAGEAEEAKHVWRETARRRAQQGVPMEMVLGSYTLGTRLLWEALLDRRGQPGIDDTDLLEAGQGVWHALDVQNAVFIEAYRREESRLAGEVDDRRSRVLDALLSGRAGDPQAAAEVRSVLGLGAAQALLVVVVLPGADGSLPLRVLEDRLAVAGARSHWRAHEGLGVGLVPLEGEGGEELVRSALGDALTSPAGTAAARGGLGEVDSARRLAARAAETLPRGRGGLIDVTERLPELLLADSPEVTRVLLEVTLARLLALPGPARQVHLDTLRALLRHGNSPTHAAQELYCHRNTVLYRREQIQAITGLQLSDPRARLMLELALLRVDPPGARSGPPGER